MLNVYVISKFATNLPTTASALSRLWCEPGASPPHPVTLAQAPYHHGCCPAEPDSNAEDDLDVGTDNPRDEAQEHERMYNVALANQWVPIAATPLLWAPCPAHTQLHKDAHCTGHDTLTTNNFATL